MVNTSAIRMSVKRLVCESFGDVSFHVKNEQIKVTQFPYTQSGPLFSSLSISRHLSLRTKICEAGNGPTNSNRVKNFRWFNRREVSINLQAVCLFVRFILSLWKRRHERVQSSPPGSWPRPLAPRPPRGGGRPGLVDKTPGTPKGCRAHNELLTCT